MCVIMLCDEKRPTEQMVQKAWDTNDDGGGIAWREPTGRGGEAEVVWKKGLDYAELKHLIETVPMPFVAHFRIQTHGGVRDSLTHPFPVDIKTSLALEGRTKGYVLFHNGSWNNWDEAARYAAITKGVQIPTGRWSDTRAMAWLCSLYGLGFMELLPSQKGIAFGPKDMEIFTGGGWVPINGVWCSNDHFLNRSVGGVTTFGPMCRFGQCTRKDNLDRDGRCSTHPLVPREVVVGGQSVSGNQTSNSVTGTQGVSSVQSATPFRQAAGTSQRPSISLEQAEKLRTEGKISKNLIKDIRKVFSKIAVGKVLKDKDVKKLSRVESAARSGAGQRA